MDRITKFDLATFGGSNLDLRRLYTALMISLIVTLTLSYFFYSGKINIIIEPLSDLGSKTAQDGSGNDISMIIFTISVVISAFLSVMISNTFRRWRGLKHTDIYIFLMRAAGVGWATTIIPNDIHNDIHLAGVVIVISSYWLMTVMLMQELRKFISRPLFWIYHITLESTLIICIIEKKMSIFGTSYFQKVSFIVLMIVLLLVINNLYENRELFFSNSEKTI